jgi:hypothetical protein
MTLEELFESKVPISLINEPIETAREIALRRWGMDREGLGLGPPGPGASQRQEGN